eukprot:scpid89531/ scgid24562/ 
MSRLLCCASLGMLLIAFIVVSSVPESTEATPRFFSFGGGKWNRGRVRSYRRPWNFRYFFTRRFNYYKAKPPKPKPVTSMAPATEPPTMCAPVQTCNVTDQLDSLTSALYSALFSQATEVARATAQEVFAEFQNNPAGGDCAMTELVGNMITANLIPSIVDAVVDYDLQLTLNNDNTRVLAANYTTREFPVVGAIRIILTFGGGPDLIDDSTNLQATMFEFRPPTENVFFPFPLLLQECVTTTVCGVNVTQPSVSPTPPMIVDGPDKVPILMITDVQTPILELSNVRCTRNQS